jgi:2,5-diamino-6-(ribosylamino)-4(3H)-pyrimidinone 5'-phosphate reductase
MNANPTGKEAPILTLPKVEPKDPLPFLMINMAMTADGKIATANRACSMFGSREDMRNLMLLRAQADAVMAGARTIDSNPVTLGPGAEEYRKRRLEQGLAEYNIRVIVSGAASINPDAEIFKNPQSPLILFTSGQAPAARLRKLAGLVDEIIVCGKDGIDFQAALQWLRQKWKVSKLVCEGGGELNSALFAQRLVNELHLTICPFIFGGGVAPTIADGVGAENLGQAVCLKLKSCRQLGEELFLIYEVAGE